MQTKDLAWFHSVTKFLEGISFEREVWWSEQITSHADWQEDNDGKPPTPPTGPTGDLFDDARGKGFWANWTTLRLGDKFVDELRSGNPRTYGQEMVVLVCEERLRGPSTLGTFHCFLAILVEDMSKLLARREGFEAVLGSPMSF